MTETDYYKEFLESEYSNYNEFLLNELFKKDKQIEKIKADLNEAIEDANRWKETEKVSVS